MTARFGPYTDDECRLEAVKECKSAYHVGDAKDAVLVALGRVILYLKQEREGYKAQTEGYVRVLTRMTGGEA
jgi:hypothetical protein